MHEPLPGLELASSFLGQLHRAACDLRQGLGPRAWAHTQLCHYDCVATAVDEPLDLYPMALGCRDAQMAREARGCRYHSGCVSVICRPDKAYQPTPTHIIAHVPACPLSGDGWWGLEHWEDSVGPPVSFSSIQPR